MSEFCLTLICPKNLDEKLLDVLLATPEVRLFTSMSIAAHGLAHERLSVSEQVLGRAMATQVQVLFSEKDKAMLLEKIKQSFIGTGVQYWITPVLEMGEM